jgi:hypothetical protein
MGLYRIFKDNLNGQDNSTEHIAIEAFEKAMPDPDWTPNNRYWGDFIWIIRIGTLAHVLRNAPGADDKIRARVSSACKGIFDLDREAELHMAAAWGIAWPQNISRKGGKSANPRSYVNMRRTVHRLGSVPFPEKSYHKSVIRPCAQWVYRTSPRP